MGKQAIDEPCMFCGFAPCECEGGSKKKSKATRKPRPKRPEETAPPVAPPANDDEIFGEVPTKKSRFRATPTVKERDLSYLSMLRVLMPLASEWDRKKFEAELNPPYPQDVDRRVAEWKARHG